MAITYANAKAYVARILGGETDTTNLSNAGDAILAAISEWNLRSDWSFLLMDTSDGFSVGGCSGAGAQATVTTTGSFAGVNIGVPVTGTNIPASTTVLTVNSATSITLSANLSGTVGATVTFSGDIPVRVGEDTYNMPTPIKRPYSARLTTNERTLQFKEQREIDRGYAYQQDQSTPVFYNLFNTTTFSTPLQNGKVRLFPIPGNTDVLRIRYYRPIAEPSADGDFIDAPDRYIRAGLLELARYFYLQNHDSETARLGEVKERAERNYLLCKADDEQGSEDRDFALIPLIEHAYPRMLDSDSINWEIL